MKLFNTFCTILIIFVINKIETAEISIATYEEIKDLPNHPEKLLIDIRDPEEIENTDKIPTAINVPYSKLLDAFNLSDADFKKTYDGRNKPGQKDEIILSCFRGRAAKKGAELIADLGYENVKYYAGSWLEYATKEGLKVE